MDNRRSIAGVLLIVVFLYASPCWSDPGIRIPPDNYWPGEAMGAVSLTFDDGMPTQLANAVPLLNRYGVKATFYVNPNYSIDWKKNLPAWRNVVAAGHEIGNHTDRHTCSCRHRFPANLTFCLERIGMQEIGGVIDRGGEALRALFKGELVDRSFAYPCYETFVGVGSGRTSYIPEVAKRYLAARAGPTSSNEPLNADLTRLDSFAVQGRSFEAIRVIVERDVSVGRWVILTFHGIGGEWSSIETGVLEQLLQFLLENRPRIWVAPLVTVAEHLASRR